MEDNKIKSAKKNTTAFKRGYYPIALFLRNPLNKKAVV
jgi:hypothetical protein